MSNCLSSSEGIWSLCVRAFCASLSQHHCVSRHEFGVWINLHLISFMFVQPQAWDSRLCRAAWKQLSLSPVGFVWTPVNSLYWERTWFWAFHLKHLLTVSNKWQLQQWKDTTRARMSSRVPSCSPRPTSCMEQPIPLRLETPLLPFTSSPPFSVSVSPSLFPSLQCFSLNKPHQSTATTKASTVFRAGPHHALLHLRHRSAKAWRWGFRHSSGPAKQFSDKWRSVCLRPRNLNSGL